MVTVPNYQRTEVDRPAFQQGVTARASASDFGSDIGSGFQNLGQGVAQAGAAVDHVRDLEDTAKAKDADNALAEWSRGAMYGDGGFLTLEGKAAVDARSGFETAWEEKRKEFGKGLSPGAAKYYQDASVARRNQVLETSIVHTANERKSWVKQASASRVDTFGEDALAGFLDPKKVDFNIAAGQAELRQQAQLEGWGAATLANKEAEYVSGVRKNIALRMAIDDPLAAQAYALKFKDQLTGPHQYDLENALDASVKAEQSKIEAARITDAGSGVVDVETELAKIANEDVRTLTRQRLSAAQTLANSAREAVAKQNKQDAFTVIEKGGSPDDLSIEQKSAIGVEGMSSLWTYYEKKASGEHSTMDDTVQNTTFILLAASDPEKFAKVELDDYRSHLTPANYKSLVNKQAEIVADVRKAKVEGAPLKAAFSAADDALAAVGISLVGKTGDDRAREAKRIATFQTELSNTIEEFRKSHNGTSPDYAESRKIINALLLPIVMKGPANSFLGIPLPAGTTNGLMFEAGSRGDGVTVDVNVQYDDIPSDFRAGITARLEAAKGVTPTKDEVTAEYELFLLTQ